MIELKQKLENAKLDCMVVVKGAYGPNELPGFADRIERETVAETLEWANGLQVKPIVLIRVLNMIKWISFGRGLDPDMVKRQVVDACRAYAAYSVKVDAFDAEKGEGAYMRAASKAIGEEMAKLGLKTA